MTHEGRHAALTRGRHDALSSVAQGCRIFAYAEEIELLIRPFHVQGGR
jgi:hypothetical protein